MMSRKLLFNLLLAGIILVSCAPQGSTYQVATQPAAPQPGEQQPAAPQPEVQQPAEQSSPFKGFPDEYQDIKIPPNLLEMILAGKAEVVQLPGDITVQKDEIFQLVNNPAYLEPYNFNRLADFADDHRFTAVPWRTNPDFADWVDKGVRVGLVYDANYFYAKSDKPVFEVWLYDNRAELRDMSGAPVAVLEKDKGYFWTESPPDPEILTFFIKNGCWLCWNAGGRCGCLICF